MTPDQRADRIWHHEMETCEGIHEHAERIAALEELVEDMWAFLNNNFKCKSTGCDRWVQISPAFGVCRDDRPGAVCKRIRALRDCMRELEVPL